MTSTLKLNSCAFSAQKIYPGKGSAVVRRDGKTQTFANAKSKSLANQKIKNFRVRWTPAWRKAHKKAQDTGVQARKKTRKVVKAPVSIAGLDMKHIEDAKKSADINARPPLASNRKKGGKAA